MVINHQRKMEEEERERERKERALSVGAFHFAIEAR